MLLPNVDNGGCGIWTLSAWKEKGRGPVRARQSRGALCMRVHVYTRTNTLRDHLGFSGCEGGRQPYNWRVQGGNG